VRDVLPLRGARVTDLPEGVFEAAFYKSLLTLYEPSVFTACWKVPGFCVRPLLALRERGGSTVLPRIREHLIVLARPPKECRSKADSTTCPIRVSLGASLLSENRDRV
jgi:hypothetical protein